MNLFVEYFKNTNDERQREIENSLATNLSFDPHKLNENDKENDNGYIHILHS